MPVDVSKGFDPGYFEKSVDADGRVAYYTDAVAAGVEPAGRWAGQGLAALGLEAGSIVDTSIMRNLFTDRIHPVTGERLGRKPHTFKKLDDEVADIVEALLLEEPEEMRTPERRRELTFMVRAEMGREHVNFYDVGFSVPKSVSLLQVGWSAAAAEARAAGDLAWARECEVKAEEIEQAVMDCAARIVGMAERHVYLRTGHHSATTGEVQDAAGLAAAIFMHHTSRTAAGEAVGDPQLHAHIAVWAYAQLADGADDIYRCIDARGLYEMKSYYAGVAELQLEQKLQRLGYAIVRRPDGDFEVGGLHDPKVLERFSTRTAEIVRERDPRIQAFIDRNGHAPSRAVRRIIGKNATHKTRLPKDHAPDRAQQLAEWDRKYRAATLQALTEIPETVRQHAAAAPAPEPLDAVQRLQCITLALATLQTRRATWNWAHLALEIRKTLPVLGDSISDDDADELVLAMVREALAGGDVVLLKPPAAVDMPGKRRASGESIYSKPSEFSRYATLEHLLEESRLLDDAARAAPPVLNPVTAARAVGSTLEQIQAERARLASDAGAGQDPQALSAAGLTNDQALAVYGLLTSERAVNVLVGAAGTGKSHVVSRLAQIVRAETGRRVIGVTAAENAARVLAGEGLDEAHNIAHFLGYIEGSDQRRGHLPLHAGDWLVVDEAGTVDTATLAELNEVAKARGARLLLTGDPQQLGSVEAGGAMRLIADEHGYFQIHEVKRFREAWEGPASLRIRAGDATAVREYIERGRIIEGTEEQVTAQLIRQYTGSLVAGRNALLVTDANEGAEQLAGLVRWQLIELGEVDGTGPAVTLADGNRASRGDLVRATRNRKTISAAGRKLTNRDVLVIDGVDGEQVTARRLTGIAGGQRQYSAPFEVPAAYLREHSALAYGGNIFVGQGRTVDDSYQLLSDATSRESFYVAMTRGRDRNVAGVVTVRRTDDPLLARRPKDRHVTAEALLSQAVTRQRDDLTATEYLRQQQDAEYSMPSLVSRWQTLTRDASFAAYDQVLREELTAADYERVRSDRERGTLNRYLRAAELAGGDAQAILRQAIRQRDFASARSVAGVLHGRIARLTGPPSHAALASYTAATPEITDPSAAAAAGELARLADERESELGQRAAADRPVWALHALGEPPHDPLGRQEWTTRAGKIWGWRELAGYEDPVHPVGPAPKLGAVELRATWRRAADAAGMDPGDQGIRETPEMLLMAQAREAERVRAWEPADVAGERRDTELARGAAVAEAQLSAAAARNAGPGAAGPAQELAASSKQLADELTVRSAWLGERDEHRRDWHTTHAAKLERGARARAELERRREAGELIDDYDVVKAYLTLTPEPETPAAKVAAADSAGISATGADRGAEPEADLQADREEHFRKVAEHRERAVEHPGRAEIEQARQAQARVDQERAETRAAEPAPASPEAGAHAEAQAEAELEAGD